MTKALYVGVNNVARKVKSMYVGVNNVARKVKKAYVGVNGIARLFFSGDTKISYYGTISSLSVARFNYGTGTVGNYALFAGGYNSSSSLVSTVDAYNASLTRSTPTALSKSCIPRGASVGSYLLFTTATTSNSNVVNAYNTSLTRSTPTALSKSRRIISKGASVGNYALFAGGYVTSTNSNVVDAYNASLTRSTPTVLSFATNNPGAASVGNYALFAGRSSYGKSPLNTVNAYNASLTRSTPTALSVARGVDNAAASNNNYALFASNYSSTTVDAYNASLTRSTPTVLSSSGESSTTHGVSTNDYAVFAINNVVNAYNSSLVRSILTNLDDTYTSGGASVGNYVIFGGTSSGSNKTTAYQIL